MRFAARLPLALLFLTPKMTARELVDSLQFTAVEQRAFLDPGAQVTAWADYDRDGDQDLFVGFRTGGNRLYRNDAGTFVDVAHALGVRDTLETRAAAWGDFDADGYLDLFVGFTAASPVANKLYRRVDDHAVFRDVAAEVGVISRGTTRQPAFVDFDNDGDIDLFVAYRDRPNALFRNTHGRFADVAVELGVADPRKTVGAAWCDWDRDGDLDLFVANQDGDANGFYQQASGRFVDIADSLGISARGRAATEGSVGVGVIDVNNDGWLDLYVANYGADWLLLNERGHFRNVARAWGLGFDDHSVSVAWGDVDHDGRPDLYVANYLSTERDTPDHFLRQTVGAFEEAMPPVIARDNASHGVNLVDYDEDGDLDLMLANNHAQGSHRLFRNDLRADPARRSLRVEVVDARGRAIRPGAEVRVYRAGSRQLLGTRIVDTGSGYDSQSVGPVHFGLANVRRVDVEVTSLTERGRRIRLVRNVDVAAHRARLVSVRTVD